jgi:hypothetical protein
VAGIQRRQSGALSCPVHRPGQQLAQGRQRLRRAIAHAGSGEQAEVHRRAGGGRGQDDRVWFDQKPREVVLLRDRVDPAEEVERRLDQLRQRLCDRVPYLEGLAYLRRP